MRTNPSSAQVSLRRRSVIANPTSIASTPTPRNVVPPDDASACRLAKDRRASPPTSWRSRGNTKRSRSLYRRSGLCISPGGACCRVGSRYGTNTTAATTTYPMPTNSVARRRRARSSPASATANTSAIPPNRVAVAKSSIEIDHSASIVAVSPTTNGIGRMLPSSRRTNR